MLAGIGQIGAYFDKSWPTWENNLAGVWSTSVELGPNLTKSDQALANSGQHLGSQGNFSATLGQLLENLGACWDRWGELSAVRGGQLFRNFREILFSLP